MGAVAYSLVTGGYTQYKRKRKRVCNVAIAEGFTARVQKRIKTGWRIRNNFLSPISSHHCFSFSDISACFWAGADFCANSFSQESEKTVARQCLYWGNGQNRSFKVGHPCSPNGQKAELMSLPRSQQWEVGETLQGGIFFNVLSYKATQHFSICINLYFMRKTQHLSRGDQPSEARLKY